jgi:hypothetical protein
MMYVGFEEAELVAAPIANGTTVMAKAPTDSIDTALFQR